MKNALFLVVLGTLSTYADFDLQEAIDKAQSGSIITVPAGIYHQPITIKKGITLKANGVELEVVSNKPAILIDSYKQVIIEGMNVSWKAEHKPQKGDTPYAVFLRGGKLLLKDCSFLALSSGEESPGAAAAQDQSELKIQNCRFNGFEYPIQFWNGAKGAVKDCIVMNPGHCGITIGNGSTVHLERNIVTGSGYHGIRCTGGEIVAESNLVIRNKNRGFYIGNKSAMGTLKNNLIVDNATGINVFAFSKLEIEHNVIVRSSYAGLSVVDTAKLGIEDNIITENEKGAVGFSDEKGKEPSVSLRGKNLFFGNKIESEHIDLPSKTIHMDPQFTHADDGLFSSKENGMGLENPEELQRLWEKWQIALDKG